LSLDKILDKKGRRDLFWLMVSEASVLYCFALLLRVLCVVRQNIMSQGRWQTKIAHLRRWGPEEEEAGDKIYPSKAYPQPLTSFNHVPPSTVSTTSQYSF
jgi:hypothetical protein